MHSVLVWSCLSWKGQSAFASGNEVDVQQSSARKPRATAAPTFNPEHAEFLVKYPFLADFMSADDLQSLGVPAPSASSASNTAAPSSSSASSAPAVAGSSSSAAGSVPVVLSQEEVDNVFETLQAARRDWNVEPERGPDRAHFRVTRGRTIPHAPFRPEPVPSTNPAAFLELICIIDLISFFAQ